MDVSPAAICLVAYNVRARDEMLERTADLAGLGIRTLNGLALAIQSGRPPFESPARRRSPRVIEEREVRSILDDLVGGRRQAMADPMAAWIEALTTSRLGLIEPARVERDFGGDVKGFATVLPRYRAILAERGLVDFDEQILGAIEVLLTDPGARAAARRACAVLLVDEFQDLTPAHVLLLRLISGPVAEVFGVGDDDQTIYGYAGASPEWLIDFARLFPPGATHDLQVNYRCSPEVISAASTLLTHNRRRIAKTVVAGPGRQPVPGADPDRAPLRVTSSSEPTVDTVARVVQLLDQGVDPSHIAVLARVNAVLLGPMLALDEIGVPTSAPIDESFLGRTGVAGALAWLRLAVAADGRLAGADLETAVRRPPRGLSPRLAGWVGERTSSRDLLALADRLNDERDRQKVSGFLADLEMVRERAAAGATSGELLVAVRDDLGLGKVLEQRLDASRRSVDRSAHGDDLAALVSVARLHPDASDFGPWIARRLGAVARDWSGVRLSTIHRVKGREWPHVIVHDVSLGLFPHRLSTDVEEERRVFHVAVTRASQTLLVAAGSPPSAFVGELTQARDPSAEPEPATEPSRRRATGPGPTARPEIELDGDEAELADTLRSWRKVRSASDSVPAYVVFDDRTLEALVTTRPADERELLAVRGIGPAKVEKYGSAILALLAGEPVPPSRQDPVSGAP
jgi:DNA helicase-2/ATP-dependent DNA helicase PcrA